MFYNVTFRRKESISPYVFLNNCLVLLFCVVLNTPCRRTRLHLLLPLTPPGKYYCWPTGLFTFRSWLANLFFNNKALLPHLRACYNED